MAAADPVRYPLLHRVSSGAQALGHGTFPSTDEWAREMEHWLEFARAHDVLSRFLPVLRGPQAKCESALAELATAYFIECRCNMPIVEWEPLGANGKRGEFSIQLAPFSKMFVEVKSPGWEDEIAKGQGQDSPRLTQPKYLQAEARATAPWASVRHAVTKAYPKMPDTMPTLLVIADDLMVSLLDWPLNVEIALHCPKAPGHTTGYLAEDGNFVGRRFERLGAVGIFQVDLPGNAPRYRFQVFTNPNALPSVALPSSALDEYRRHNTRVVTAPVPRRRGG